MNLQAEQVLRRVQAMITEENHKGSVPRSLTCHLAVIVIERVGPSGDHPMVGPPKEKHRSHPEAKTTSQPLEWLSLQQDVTYYHIAKIPQSKDTAEVEAEKILVQKPISRKRKAEKELEDGTPPKIRRMSSPKVEKEKSQSTGKSEVKLITPKSANEPINSDKADKADNTFLANLATSPKSWSDIAPVAFYLQNSSEMTITPVDKLVQINRSSEDFKVQYLEYHKLGEGGFGSVFAGTRIADAKDVAIKHIPKDKVRYMIVKFQDEYFLEISEVVLMAQAAGLLCQGSVSNPGVIGLVDVFEFESEVLIITDRSCCEMDMDRFYNLINGQITERETKVIFKQLVDVSIRMHKNGVFHRDIKGGNILVSVEGEDPSVKIIDFGCGDWVTEKPYKTYAGTEGYTPPEFSLHSSYQAEQTTVWQIGQVLWSYHCEGVFNLKDYMKNPNLPVNHLSHDGKDFLKQCLTIDPDQRPTLEDLQLHPWLN
ncbi:serine/threonine-protein kinase pim-2-like [Gouania willdenowi]|uniref:serine/threonine-protein kinase pim-2-like n=1 Tax=Gouania willdenowi TaxID=441366 RepID=UPI0010541769|nr:serine/threonine-protein kinase pim-2-like [Gouania willdenowi]